MIQQHHSQHMLMKVMITLSARRKRCLVLSLLATNAQITTRMMPIQGTKEKTE